VVVAPGGMAKVQIEQNEMDQEENRNAQVEKGNVLAFLMVMIIVLLIVFFCLLLLVLPPGPVTLDAGRALER
jgi:hypothetical protein